MAAPVHKAGSNEPQVTGEVSHVADKSSTVVTVEGLYSALKSADPEDYVPDGYTLESSTCSPSGNGLGKLTVNCLKYDSGSASSFTPVRTTFRVDMAEVQYDLEDHPKLANVRDKVLAWLATDESERVKDDKFYYHDAESDEALEITEEPAKMFCAAYMAGIKTFNRYFPVVEKISVWKTLQASSSPGAHLPAASCRSRPTPARSTNRR